MKRVIMRRKCGVCETELQPMILKTNMQNDFVMLGLCDEHQPEPEPERDIQAEWESSDREILKAAARGEILDAEGKPVPAVSVLQLGNGNYETHYYALDLLGELVELEST